jgi:hypothetical protein
MASQGRKIVELLIHVETYGDAARAFDRYQVARDVFAETAEERPRPPSLVPSRDRTTPQPAAPITEAVAPESALGVAAPWQDWSTFWRDRTAHTPVDMGGSGAVTSVDVAAPQRILFVSRAGIRGVLGRVSSTRGWPAPGLVVAWSRVRE